MDPAVVALVALLEGAVEGDGEGLVKLVQELRTALTAAAEKSRRGTPYLLTVEVAHSGYFGKWVDAVINIFTNSTLAFPPLILLFAIVAVFKPSVW